MVGMAVPIREQHAEHSRGHWPAPGTIHEQWTADDLARFPDDGLRYEIIDGTLVVSPSPIKRHQWVSRRLQRILEDACPTGYTVFNAPLDWKVDDGTVVEPDLLVIPDDDIDQPVHSPVLLVGILSASSRHLVRVTKFARYAEAGVPRYWIVDPGASDRGPGIDVFDLVDGAYVLQVEGAGARTVAVEGPVPVAVTPAGLVA